MTQFKVGDLVTVDKQPQAPAPNYYIKTMGMSGYIEEIVGEFAQFVELTERGYGGMGAIPLSCLSLQNSNAKLLEFKRIKDEADALRLQQYADYTQKYNELLNVHLLKISEETGVSSIIIEKIFEAHNRFLKEKEYIR